MAGGTAPPPHTQRVGAVHPGSIWPPSPWSRCAGPASAPWTTAPGAVARGGRSAAPRSACPDRPFPAWRRRPPPWGSWWWRDKAPSRPHGERSSPHRRAPAGHPSSWRTPASWGQAACWTPFPSSPRPSLGHTPGSPRCTSAGVDVGPPPASSLSPKGPSRGSWGWPWPL
ncbi:MAG: hypothetical protein A4E31_01171 [Methanomassiliicoccales archaeon PtaU1.Bin030]|nr:MAG: hypothetical protein A4E31_01171 [Methanomassiliicoccales archaeon PtaU1.Bin030]